MQVNGEIEHFTSFFLILCNVRDFFCRKKRFFVALTEEDPITITMGSYEVHVFNFTHSSRVLIKHLEHRMNGNL